MISASQVLWNQMNVRLTLADPKCIQSVYLRRKLKSRLVLQTLISLPKVAYVKPALNLKYIQNSCSKVHFTEKPSSPF